VAGSGVLLVTIVVVASSGVLLGGQ